MAVVVVVAVAVAVAVVVAVVVASAFVVVKGVWCKRFLEQTLSGVQRCCESVGAKNNC